MQQKLADQVNGPQSLQAQAQQPNIGGSQLSALLGVDQQELRAELGDKYDEMGEMVG